MLKIELEELNIISAGAGSGKTYTVQKTLSTWLKEHPEKIKPDRILAVTFTNMAASEMQLRIKSALLSSGNMDAAAKVASSQISTIHSFGQGIVQSFSYEVGMSPEVRQLSEAEEKILLQLTLSSHEQINTILKKLETLGYKGKYDGKEYSTALEQLQKRVLGLINTLRTIGATKGKASYYIDQLSDEIKALYGPTEDATTLNTALHNAVTTMLSSYPNNMKDEFGGNDAADKALTANYKALKKAATLSTIENDWELWVSLQSLRLTKIKDENYIGLAEAVMEAAQKLSVHPGPLEEAIEHISTILQISIDTLENYNEEKRKNALIDFSDMVHIANSIMNEDAYIQEMADAFDCLVIDEFQDTNPIQFALLWKFRQSGLPTLIVGDIKQSIMGFQGADPSLFASLIKDKAGTLNQLEYNWRSTPALMEWINAMGKGLYGDTYTRLTPKSTYPSTLTPLQIIDFDTSKWSANGSKDGSKKSFVQDQHHVISQHIQSLIDSKTIIWDRYAKKERPIEPADIAILAPSHTMLGRAASSLREYGLEAQIKQDGWFASRIVQVAFHALSYLVNPLDKHAILYMLVTELGDMSLQDALTIYLPDKVFTHPLIDKIDDVRKTTYALTLSGQLISLIESLDLWSYVMEHENSSQERANLLKLIDLCSEFESLQYESLNALGIYGRNLNSFLAWLSLNENDTQPAPKSINNEAVQLLTWHASKGLEWPVVIVMGMDNDKGPSLPDISIGYTDTTRDNPLNNSYIKFFPEFQDGTTNEKFIETLKEEAHSTLTNLLYVAMTRAREQLILPWPSFKEKKVSEFTFMHKLLHKCNFVIEETSVSMAYLTREAGFRESIVSAMPAEEPVEDLKSTPINYGRIAIKQMPEAKQIPAQISPSGIINDEIGSERDKLVLSDYGTGVDLSKINMDAAELGTLIHHCYHVLLEDTTLEGRLFDSLMGKVPENVFDQLKTQVRAFNDFSNDELHACNLQNEVPILSRTAEGSIVSGAIDLLIETSDGYWIIDHKTDRVVDFAEQFAHHYPQLEAYAKFTKLEKPLLGVGINWVRYGKMSLLPF